MANLTFLMKRDTAGAQNRFYTLAKQYFDDAGTEVIDAPAIGQTLEGVFTKLRALKVPQKTINLVSHASGFAAMECPVTLASQAAGRRTMMVEDLQDTLAAKSLAPPGPAVITSDTRVVIYGCDVGRSESFLRLLSGLFGDPGQVLAPRRLGVFMVDGTTVKYRQAQSWSLVRKPPLVIGAAAAPVGGWPAYRAKFVIDASLKFGRLAIATEPLGPDRLTTMLTNAAATATMTFGPSFFLEEGVQIFPDGTQSAADAAASVAPRSNGDPVTALPKSRLELDDTTVVTTISGSDAYPENTAQTKYAITVAILGQILQRDVSIADGPDYRSVTTSKGVAPSPGPRPVGGGTGSGGGSSPHASNDQLQLLIDQLLADGAAQTDVDELVALVPSGDATEGLSTAITDDDMFDEGDGIALLPPSRVELA